MEYVVHSHRFAIDIIENNSEINALHEEILDVISSISAEELKTNFNNRNTNKGKSLSTTINKMLKIGLESKGWNSESNIFFEENFDKGAWRIDFVKGSIALEVAFNHSTVVAWNLMKPTLSSELNHVKKNIDTELGIIICITEELKRDGNFDGAVGTLSHFKTYLPAMYNKVTVPILIIGLKGISGLTFEKNDEGKYIIT